MTTTQRIPIDRALQILTALTAALMAASAGQHWPTLVLFAVAVLSGVFSGLSSRVVGATKPVTIADVVVWSLGLVVTVAVPAAQATDFKMPSAAVVVLAVVGGVMGVGAHGPFAPQAAP